MHQHKRKLFDDQTVCEITVSTERYDETTDQALDDTVVKFYTMEYQYSNTQEGDYEFNRDDDPIQDSIDDINAYFDEKFLKISVNE